MYEATGRLTARSRTKGTLRLPPTCKYETYLAMPVPEDVVEEKPVKLMGGRGKEGAEVGGYEGYRGGKGDRRVRAMRGMGQQGELGLGHAESGCRWVVEVWAKNNKQESTEAKSSIGRLAPLCSRVGQCDWLRLTS